MSAEICSYEENGEICSEPADYKVSFSRPGSPPFGEKEEVYFACGEHKKKLVRDVKKLYQSLNIKTGVPKIKGMGK